MNVTAIRYYIDNALLTPQKKNNQYIFDQSCVGDYKDAPKSVQNIKKDHPDYPAVKKK
jgi:hypothetical protein